jgi:hypothetical protein
MSYGDCASPCDVGRSHSPIILKPLEADGRGGIMVLVFLCVACVVCCVVHEFFFMCAALLVLFVVLCSTK